MSTPTTPLEKLAAIRAYALRQAALGGPEASEWQQVAHHAKEKS